MHFSAACLVLILLQTIGAGAGSSTTTRSAAVWQSTPLAITPEEFDEDGVRDLAGAYATADGNGFLVVWLVDPQSLTSCSGTATDPLPGPPIVTAVTVRPELLATGDFDNDGHRDVAAAERGATSLVVLLGEGTGRFVAERGLDVSGRITSLASGDVNLADGLADLAVGVVAGESSRLLVFEGPGGALRSVPESVDLASPARRITIGQFDGPSYGDLEAVCDLSLIHI